ncbi:MAG TPA: prolyl oligopeptidase family serine peptidase [Solirubrobacterales bacterium]|nr:prolyl oligopeptidase family serine peptidase [Solirubrobacterales bacterium]
MVIVVILIAIAAAGWSFSSDVLVPDYSAWSDPIEVKAVGPHQIVLGKTNDTTRPGIYGLDWEGGHAVLGPVVSVNGDSVTRRLRDVSGYLPPGVEDAHLDTNVYTGNPRQALGLPYRDIEVKGELGPMPAWQIPGTSQTWAIVVHGINDTPQVGLRIAPELHEMGLPTLLITYREDQGAPQSPDGFHHMGLTEWKDLEAAARYALDRGASRLVLIGYSMGGSLVTQFLEHSHLASKTAAVVLDAPALNWKAILEFNAEEMGLPGFFALPVEWGIGARIDADWSSLDALQHTSELHYPTLLFHGKEDQVVPIKTSEEFAEQLPNWVTFYAVPKADHTQSWNVDPPLYDRRLRHFLLQNGAISTATSDPAGRTVGPETKRARPESGSK